MMIRSALSTTYWLVAPRWMIPLAAEALFVLSGPAEVDVIELRLHLPKRVFADAVQPQLALAPRQLQPETAPQPELVPRREQPKHLRAGVAAGEGGFVGVVAVSGWV